MKNYSKFLQNWFLSYFIYGLIALIFFIPINTLSEELEGVIEKKAEIFILEAKDIYLKELIQEFKEKYGINILGLENKENQKISIFVSSQDIHEIIKKLLKYLEEKNYTLEFYNNTLSRVTVFPSSTNEKKIEENFIGLTEKKEEEFVNIVKILGIEPNSQAQGLALRPNDIVLEYDGVKIENAEQLVEEVKNKYNKSQVEMLVISDGLSVRHILNGGLIGIRIVTDKISFKEYEKLY
ncbi:MAG: PDZ domain-containing protein [Desulfobacterales bacterium]|nr:PDZ domain-containing protein [Desulfobacterales bacterium]